MTKPIRFLFPLVEKTEIFNCSAVLDKRFGLGHNMWGGFTKCDEWPML